jgi:iron complex transport system ATP-binding protein
MMLEARHLAIGYRNRLVGEALDLVLEPGQVLAILGPNGGGKTTLLKTLLGLIPPLAGEVRVNGKGIAQLSVRERARLIGYVPQIHSGAFAFTVEEVVLMGRSAHASLFTAPSRSDHAVARAAIDRLGIADLADRPYTMISGGERQLALIARALAQQAQFVLLDEPTASLDFGNQGKVMREVRRLAASGLAIALATHDPNQALHIADHALLIKDGHRYAGGPCAEVLTPATLRGLYSAEISAVEGKDGARAFLPI